MKIFMDEKYIQRRVKLGERVPLIAMGLLLISVVLSTTRPEWFGLTMGLTLGGFTLSVAGSYFLHRFIGENAHHKAVPAALKGLNDRYALLIYELPVPFVLVEPGGVTGIVVKNQSGKIRYENGSWQHQQKGRLLRQIGGQESVGNLERQVADVERQLRDYLEVWLPEETEVPVRGVALFTNSDAYVEAEEAPVPVLHATKFKNWLRGEGNWPNLPAETQRELRKALKVAAEEE